MTDRCSASVQSAHEPIVQREWTSEGILFQLRLYVNTHQFVKLSPLMLIYSTVYWFVFSDKMADSPLILVRSPVNQTFGKGSIIYIINTHTTYIQHYIYTYIHIYIYIYTVYINGYLVRPALNHYWQQVSKETQINYFKIHFCANIWACVYLQYSFVHWTVRWTEGSHPVLDRKYELDSRWGWSAS